MIVERKQEQTGSFNSSRAPFFSCKFFNVQSPVHTLASRFTRSKPITYSPKKEERNCARSPSIIRVVLDLTDKQTDDKHRTQRKERKETTTEVWIESCRTQTQIQTGKLTGKNVSKQFRATPSDNSTREERGMK